MRLTRYSDYALRTLLYLGLHGRDLASIGDIARAYRISENHLTKVVHHLGRLGFVETVNRFRLGPGQLAYYRVPWPARVYISALYFGLVALLALATVDAQHLLAGGAGPFGL